MSEPTPKQWKRRALAAEAQLEMLKKLRTFDKDMEMQAQQDLCAARVALKEAQDAIQWALGEQS
jgi:hypothetical protein